MYFNLSRQSIPDTLSSAKLEQSAWRGGLGTRSNALGGDKDVEQHKQRVEFGQSILNSQWGFGGRR